MRIHLVLVLAFTCWAAPVPAHASTDCSQQLEYENHNQVDYGPLKVGIVSGNVIDGVNAPVIGACVLLFNEQNHELVIKTVADAKGRFRLANVAAGRYRLLIKVEGLCTANVPIVLGPTAEKKAITVHMKPRGVDDCSYGELR